MFDFQTQPANCPGCGEPCEAVTFGKAIRYLCDFCAAADAARARHADRKNECLELWRRHTPTEYQQPIIRERLAADYLPAMDHSGMEGIALIGPSGGGKTRIAYALLKKASLAGKKTYSISHSLFRQSVAERHSNDKEIAATAQNRLAIARNVPFLLFDDVGKGTTAEAGSEALYELLAHRRDKRLVTHWTANNGSAWIVSRYGPDRGPAIAIRLANLAGCYSPGTGRIFTQKNK